MADKASDRSGKADEHDRAGADPGAGRPPPKAEAAGSAAGKQPAAALHSAAELAGRIATGAASRLKTKVAKKTPSFPLPLDILCRTLLRLLCKRYPELRPEEPLLPGVPGPTVPVPAAAVPSLLEIAAQQAVLEAAGIPIPPREDQLVRAVLWQDGADALLVEVGGIGVELGDGIVSVTIGVGCDQLPRGRDTVVVDLVLGTPERPTGMLVAAMDPRGPEVVVRRWGGALTALAWQALLDASGGIARATGVDADGAPLVPTALAASRLSLDVLPQARHEMDRLRVGRVVGVGGAPRL